MNILQTALRNVVKQMDSVVDVTCYSGRGMMGKSCVAIIGARANCADILKAMLIAAYQDAFDAAQNSDSFNDTIAANKLQDAAVHLTHLAFYHSEDAMGYDVVWYWPDIMWEDQ